MLPKLQSFPSSLPAASVVSATFARSSIAAFQLPSLDCRFTTEQWIRGPSPRNSPSRSAKADGARVELRRITDIGEPNAFHVSPRDALNGFWCDTLQLVDEPIGLPIVSFIEL